MLYRVKLKKLLKKLWIKVFNQFTCTGGPSYMRQIATKKSYLNKINSHIKIPRMTVNWRVCSRKNS